MKRIKKVVDERQEMELLKIEHTVLWIVFWSLLVSLIVQSLFMDAPFAQYLPEFVVFMVCCVGILIGCVKKGQWDFWTHPTPKTYAVSAAIGSVGFGLIYGIAMYLKNDNWHGDVCLLILVTGILIVFMFAFIFAVCAWVGHMVKKKREKLANAYGDDEDDQ